MPQVQPGSSNPVVWTVVGSFALYLVTASVLATATGQAVWTLLVWNPEIVYPLWLRPCTLAFGLSGVSIALVVPALPWVLVLARRPLRPAPLYQRAFLLNLLQTTLLLSASKALLGHVPTRAVFILWQATVAGSGLLALVRMGLGRQRAPIDSTRPVVAGVLVLLLGLPTLLWDKTFVEDSSGDGTEAYEFSRSLATHQLPYWDLENGYYGFYPNFMLFAYPTQLAFIALGESEGAHRLPVFLYLLGTYLALAELARARQRRLSWIELALLLGATGYFIIYHGHYSTYELVSDLAEPAGVDTFFTFLATAAGYELFTRQRAWWALFALAGVMALAAGTPFAGLFLLGRLIAERPALRWTALRAHVLDAAAFLILWLSYQGFVFVYTRFHPLGTTKWDIDNLSSIYPITPDWTTALELTVRFCWVIAIVPLAGLAVGAIRGDRLARMLAAVCGGYGLLLFTFTRTHTHYLIPLSMFPAALLLRALAKLPASSAGQTRLLTQALYGVALLGFIMFTLPFGRTPHTAYREIGRRTLMRYDSYSAAVQAVERLIESRPALYCSQPEGLRRFPWEQLDMEIPENERLSDLLSMRVVEGDDAPYRELSHHLWVRYADKSPVAGHVYDQVLTTEQLASQQHLPGFAREPLAEGWVLFTRTPELSAQSSPQ
jgi:hypothetical protein